MFYIRNLNQWKWYHSMEANIACFWIYHRAFTSSSANTKTISSLQGFPYKNNFSKFLGDWNAIIDPFFTFFNNHTDIFCCFLTFVVQTEFGYDHWTIKIFKRKSCFLKKLSLTSRIDWSKLKIKPTNHLTQLFGKNQTKQNPF